MPHNLRYYDDFITDSSLTLMLRLATEFQHKASVFGATKVGAAVMSSSGELYGGCNIEHRWRCHDIHAEVCAIAAMVAAGATRLRAVVVVANRRGVSPCGGCLDWIFQFGGSQCLVGWRGPDPSEFVLSRAHELMPRYPSEV